MLHGFTTQADLVSDLFTPDLVIALAPLLKADPEIRIHTVV